MIECGFTDSFKRKHRTIVIIDEESLIYEYIHAFLRAFLLASCFKESRWIFLMKIDRI